MDYWELRSHLRTLWLEVERHVKWPLPPYQELRKLAGRPWPGNLGITITMSQ